MSKTYSDLGNKFPDEVDTIQRMSDVSYNYISLINQYYAYKNAGNDAAAQAIITSNPTLETMILNADKINYISDVAISLERFFKDDVETYLAQKFKYIGEYDVAATYLVGNIISYNGECFICNVATSTGVAPTPHINSTNWVIIAKQGIQGASGIGLAPKGIWNSTTQYAKDDFVAYHNTFWQALASNLNSEPTNDNTNWLNLADIGVVDDYIIATDVGTATDPSLVEADKLRNAVKIGNASFDATKDITLSQIGAAKATITGSSAPTTATVADVGQLYLNTTDGSMYKCTANAAGIYTWMPVSSEGWLIGDKRDTFRTDLGTNWALRNGAALSSSLYPDLATILGGTVPKMENFKKIPNLIASGMTVCINRIRWVNSYSRYIAVGSNGSGAYICYTTDPINGPWTAIQISSNTYYIPRDFCIFGSYLVVLLNNVNSNNYVLAYSTTPFTVGSWNINANIYAPSNTTSKWNNLATDGSHFIIIYGQYYGDYQYVVFTSPTYGGLAVNMGGSLNIAGVQYDSQYSRFLIIACEQGTGACKIWYTTDPTAVANWHYGCAIASANWLQAGGFKCVNGNWVIIKMDNTSTPAFAHATDPLGTWTIETLPYHFNNFYSDSIAYTFANGANGGYWVMTMAGSNVLYSTQLSGPWTESSAFTDSVINFCNIREDEGGALMMYGEGYAYFFLYKYMLPLDQPASGYGYIKIK